MKSTNRQPVFSTMKVFCSAAIAVLIVLAAAMYLTWSTAPTPTSRSANIDHSAFDQNAAISFSDPPAKLVEKSEIEVLPTDDDKIDVSLHVSDASSALVSETEAEAEPKIDAAVVQAAASETAIEEENMEETHFQNLFGLPVGSEKSKGALVIGGGGKLSEEIYQEFIRLAGGKKARIVLIPSAYPYRDMEHIQRRLCGWQSYEFESLEYLHTDDPDDADRDEFCKPLETATGVWFGGGSQGRLAHRYANRKVEKLLHEIVARGGVVGGTSAGASILSQLMIRDGSYSSARTDRGLGLSERLVVDQHFSQRGRFPRLIGVLEENLGRVGLGIDERTCVVIKGDEVSAIGEGFANLFVGPSHQGEGTSIFRIKGGQTVQGNQIVRKESSPENRGTLRKP